jgi:hypothetical protein
MVHLIFSVLKEMELLSDEGAEKLGQALSTEILSSSVTDSQAQVHRVFEQVKKDIRSDLTLEPWIDHVKKLEKRVAQLEKPKTTNKSKKLAL